MENAKIYQASEGVKILKENASPALRELLSELGQVKNLHTTLEEFQESILLYARYKELMKTLADESQKLFYSNMAVKNKFKSNKEGIIFSGLLAVGGLVGMAILYADYAKNSNALIFWSVGVLVVLSMLFIVYNIIKLQSPARKQALQTLEKDEALYREISKYRVYNQTDYQKYDRFKQCNKDFIQPLFKIIAEDTKPKQNIILNADFLNRYDSLHVDTRQKDTFSQKYVGAYTFTGTHFYRIPFFSLKTTFSDDTKILMSATENIRIRGFSKYKRKGNKTKAKTKGITSYKIQLQIQKEHYSLQTEKLKTILSKITKKFDIQETETSYKVSLVQVIPIDFNNIYTIPQYQQLLKMLTPVYQSLLQKKSVK